MRRPRASRTVGPQRSEIVLRIPLPGMRTTLDGITRAAVYVGIIAVSIAATIEFGPELEHPAVEVAHWAGLTASAAGGLARLMFVEGR